MIFKQSIILIMSFFLLSPLLIGQRTCGMKAHMDQLLSDPVYQKEYLERQAEFEAYNLANPNRVPCTAANKIILPIAIHFEGAANPNRACLVALAKAQVQILNDDYAGTNADISNWANNAGDFPAGTSNGESCLEFCLPTMGHPASSGLVNGDDAVTINVYTGDSAPGWAGYINVYVRNIGNILGYSPLGGNGGASQGVTISNSAFGPAGAGCPGFIPGAPFNRGRTLTHELGHNLNLDHIWGNGCGVDDGVADTPSQFQEYYNCPANPSSSCGSNDMHMNYMDYVNDACMYMFTAGQVVRMENWVNSNMQNVINKGQQVCSAAAVCPPFLNETANISSGTQQIEAINYITSESDITGSANIQYNAGDYVELRAGFVAATPATFCAIIQACVPFTSEDDEQSNLTDGSDDNDTVTAGYRTDSTIQVDIDHVEAALITIYNVDGEKVISDQKVSSDDAGMINFEAEINELETEQVYYFVLKNDDSQKTGKFIILNEDKK